MSLHPDTLLDHLRTAPTAQLKDSSSDTGLCGEALCVCVEEMAAGLEEMGVRPGELVAWPAQPRAQWLALELACMVHGAVAAPIPETGEVGSTLPAAHRLTQPPIAAAPLSYRHSFPPQGPVALKFTSGTTAPRRAVAATAAHYAHMWEGLQALFSLSASDRVLAILPAHTWLQRCVMMLALQQGSTVVVLDRPRRMLRALRQVRPTIVLAVPRVLKTVLDLATRTDRPLPEVWGGHLRSLWTGSAPLPPATLSAYQKAALPLHEGYGSTETGMIAKNAPGAARPGTVGRLFPGVSVRLDDGEVVVRCAALANTAYIDGQSGRWSSSTEYRTGDLGALDEDGFLQLRGRADHRISLSTGHKLVPQTIERALLSSPGIQDCAVVGHGRPWPVVLLVTDLCTERLRGEVAACMEHLPEHARVRNYATVSSLEDARTSSGKLDRTALLHLHAARIASLYEP